MVVKRGVNEGSIVEMARPLPLDRPHSALYRVHGRRTHQRLADEGRRHGRGNRTSRRRTVAVGAHRAQLPGRGREPVELSRRRRRDRHHPIGHRALLRRLHARAVVSRGAALHLPVRDRRDTTCARSCAATAPTEEISGTTLASIWHVRDDRYSELRSAETIALPKVEMSHIGG